MCVISDKTISNSKQLVNIIINATLVMKLLSYRTLFCTNNK